MTPSPPSDHGTIITNITASTQHFPFFALPRELRDAIYDLVLKDTVLFKSRYDRAGTKRNPKVTVRNVAVTHALLLSKQFNIEYKERMHGRSVLHLVDSGAYVKVPHLEHLPVMETIELKLLVFAPSASHRAHELRIHKRWIDEVLAQVRKPKKVDFYIVVNKLTEQNEHASSTSSQDAELDSFLNSVGSTSAVLQSIHDKHNNNGDTVRSERPNETWTAEVGWKGRT